MNKNDTICALATPIGGALAIIRLSGENAIGIVDSILKRPVLHTASANTIHYAHIQNNIDDVLISLMRAPHSYTGENSVEISCHASPFIVQQILQKLIEAGARQAEPGEFTQRAFLNGKLDLTQAEAVADLIASASASQHRAAMGQLRGGFSKRLDSLRERLLNMTSLLELELDFSDHEDLEFADRSELMTLATEIDKEVLSLAESFKQGNAIKNGIPVAIIGRPNVGKSSLLNALIGEERAIVADIPGTTRDTIEDTMHINDQLYRFVDTAGIRTTNDTIERIGVERAYQQITRAQLILWVIDSIPTNEEIEKISKHIENHSCIIVCNKSDLSSLNLSVLNELLPHYSTIHTSAKNGEGIEALKQLIYEATTISNPEIQDVVITNSRHYTALIEAHESLAIVIKGLKNNLSGDLLSFDLRAIINSIGTITGGSISSQDILNNIFAHFCIGK